MTPTYELHPEAHPDVVEGKLHLGVTSHKSDPRTPSILKMIDLQAPKIKVPTSVIRTDKLVGDWGMLGNDSMGDCEWAEYAHTLMLLSAVEKKGFATTTAVVTNAYLKYTGGQDTGSDMLECANLRLKETWANFGAPVADAFVGLDLGSKMKTAVESSIYVLGSASLGVDLPLALQKTPYDWTYMPTAAERKRSDWQPGGWGGHAVDGLDFDAHGPWIITWGQRVKVSWMFLLYIMDQGIGYMHPFWRNRAGKSPVSLTAAQTLKYIKSGAL